MNKENLAESSKEVFSVSFKSMAGFTLLVSFGMLLTISIGIVSQEPVLVAIGLFMFTLLMLIRFRFRVLISESEIESTNLLGSKKLKFCDLESCFWAHNYAYPKDRFFGPSTYALRSNNGVVYINFKFYPIECSRNVMRRTKAFYTTKP